ncbi:hypothetical protein HY087_02200 [Candidatus Gottesmanbacteria bacterium]|nr:hypothetical protein [Candidatus Gottesmanbacteria bacterium]
MAIRVESNCTLEIGNLSKEQNGQNRYDDDLVHPVTAVSPNDEAVPMGWFQAHSKSPGAWIGPPPLLEGSEHIDLSQPGSTATFQRGGVEIRYVSILVERLAIKCQ